jgi:hypothetical protein
MELFCSTMQHNLIIEVDRLVVYTVIVGHILTRLFHNRNSLLSFKLIQYLFPFASAAAATSTLTLTLNLTSELKQPNHPKTLL